MDGVRLHFPLRMLFSFLLVVLLQTSTEAQATCSVPRTVNFTENNHVNDVVMTITADFGVTVAISSEDKNLPFKLNEYKLLATSVLDYETEQAYTVRIVCTLPDGTQPKHSTVILLNNLNDNAPQFAEDVYTLDVSEMSPVNTSVGLIKATDSDGPLLYYTLTPESSGFKLRSSTTPEILVQTPLEYDEVKYVQLTLHVQDTPLGQANSEDTKEALTTIMMNITDVDDRVPWFQPCTKQKVGGVWICLSSAYTGSVIVNEQQIGPLPLNPGPLYAIDGDSGINEMITYSILTGNDDDLFEINQNSGNITMLKPAEAAGTISLTVLAAQAMVPSQYATITVTISVQLKTLHPPQFQSSQYECTITGVGKAAMEKKNKDNSLLIIATDADYAATGDLNPHITYQIVGHSDFYIVNGYLFMINKLEDTTLTLKVMATDTSTGESATAQLLVEVTESPTTSVPPSTTGSTDTTPTGEFTTASKTTEATETPVNPSTSTESSTSTPSSTMTTTSGKTTEDTVSPTTPSLSTDSASTPIMTTSIVTESIISTTQSTIQPGGYGSADMAALGATLGVLLFICLGIIGFFIFRTRREKGDWHKIYETNKFRSSLGQGSGGQREGIQYTNDAYQNDEDGGSIGSSSPDGGNVMSSEEPKKAAVDFTHYEDILDSSVPMQDDDTSQASSDKTDSEKEVKPILTKERRMDEGYKSVWFKEDIDPDARQEVVIIPDNTENDSDVDPAEDSEDDNTLTVNL